jgi:hypothetical protein
VRAVCQVVEGRSLHLHRAVLCARSSYFAAMFGGGMREAAERSVYLAVRSLSLSLSLSRFLY